MHFTPNSGEILVRPPGPEYHHTIPQRCVQAFPPGGELTGSFGVADWSLAQTPTTQGLHTNTHACTLTYKHKHTQHTPTPNAHTPRRHRRRWSPRGCASRPPLRAPRPAPAPPPRSPAPRRRPRGTCRPPAAAPRSPGTGPAPPARWCLRSAARPSTAGTAG